jgi:hypothetical protein
MYRKHHNGQLSNEEIHVPFGGTWKSVRVRNSSGIANVI